MIPINPKAQNPFWENSARDLLLACMLHYYKDGSRSLISIADEITSKPINDIINDIASSSGDDTPEHKIISRYVGMADETLSGINAQMSSSLSLFITDSDIRYMLRDNPNKANPSMLSNGFSVYLSIAEHKLSEYSRLLHLIINQTISEMEQRSEDSFPTLILIDELARILSSGRIYKLENSLETLRSRKATVMLISQSLDAIQRAYQKPEVEGMLQNCPYKIILSSSSKDTTDSVIRWAGKFKCDRYSHGRSGHGYSRNISYEDKPRVESSDLITLPSKDEVIIITPYGYNRVKKVKYYNDSTLSKISKEVQQSWKH
ncbi:MAG: type IV secretory system conjugative DNA transfer family protein [Lachnospiraceae bacterium]|nr:type IV secretory system conjugative DNA transfer family protein [Lachnospiraceae bacterium]